ncbi:phosphatase PAP2 family protein [Nocardioides aquiterrae]|uniref:Phosphatase PAP2 family protein n=1 Tax=Nocardioides aquiterrae TaxID=203799 RepID=A0ABN1UFS1_9ACTN
MTHHRPPTRYVVVAVLAVLALLGALVGPAVYGLVTGSTAKDRIAADPPPSFFPDATTHRIDALTDPQQARATTLMQRWWDQHGTATDDTAFQAFLEANLPGPPDAARRSKEMTEVERLDRERTAAGITAATWLEDHGKKDVWKLAVHDQAEYLPAGPGDDRKNAVDAMLAMTKTVADDLGTKFQMSAPYVLEPSLRNDHTVAPGDVCPCSYPSRHASAAAASRTFLAHFMPQRDPEYRWWQDQIDYSRIYMAGHVASDIAGGTLLGDMVGDYFLVTRGHVDPSRV